MRWHVFFLLVPAFSITRQPTPEPTLPPTRQPTLAPTSKPAYCNGPTVLTGTNGSVNYVVGNYVSKVCSWVLSARPGEVLQLNFSRIEVSVDSEYCADCSGNCMRSAQGWLYSCKEMRGQCNSSTASVVRMVCPQSCAQCDGCLYNYARGVSGGVEVMRACGSDTPMPLVVTTTSRNLIVDINWGYLLTSKYTAYSRTDGFDFTWKSIPPPVPFNGTAPCSGVKNLVGPSGSIISDGSEGFYVPNSNCLWVIRAPSDSYVSLEFSLFELKTGTSMGANGFTSCLSDYVRIYDGNVSAGSTSVLGTFCGNRIPRNLTSSQQTLSVQFISDSAKAVGVGFEALYKFTTTPGPRPQFCDGTVRVTSPGTIVQSGDYGPSSCTWNVVSPQGSYVQIEFVELSLETSFPACEYDNLEILDSNLLLMRLCDNISPPLITSFSNEVDIIFFADDYLAGSGFTMVITFVSEPGLKPYMCIPGGTMISASLEETGLVEDGPVYGRSNDKNTNCSWLIVSPPSTAIKLIYRRFELDPSCMDAVSVYDGYNSSSARIQQVCGTHLPVSVVSSRNVTLIQYEANGNVSGSGFSIRYTITSALEDLHTDRQCEGVKEYNSSSPRNISDNSDGSSPRVLCSWRVTVPQGQYISLNVTSLDLGMGDDECLFEYLTVYDGNMQDYPLLDTCGRMPAALRSTSNVLTIEYFSERARKSPGFEANWDVVNAPGTTEDRVCGGKVHPEVYQLPTGGLTSGVISQRGSMENYRHGMSCSWAIEAPKGYFVRVEFSSFNSSAPNQAGVCHNHLALLDGPKSRDYELQRLCGSTLPVPVVSTQPSMYLQLVNYGPAEFTFQAKWSFVDATPGRSCDGAVDLQGSSGNITSGGQGYANNANCSFRLQAPADELIELQFVYVALQQAVNGTCKDLLRIEANGTTLFEGCSMPNITSLTVSSNVVLVTFISDKALTAQGFLLTYNFVALATFVPTTSPTVLVSTLSPSIPQSTSPSTRQIMLEPTTMSPTALMRPSGNRSAAAAAVEQASSDVVGIVVGLLLALVLVGTVGGLLGHYFFKKRVASKIRISDVGSSDQELGDTNVKRGRGAQVSPTDDDDNAGEVTML